MVGVVTGAGLGLQNTSGFVLGSRGQLGQAALGRAGDNVYVNAANGNLVIQNTDEILIGFGPDNVIARTYNSRGTFNDDNADNWRPSVARKVTGLTGTVNNAGSTITLIDWDGSENVYAYDTTRSLYVFEEGAGAHDTLSFSSGTSTWTWQDGDSRVRDTFESHLAAGRITKSTDLDGNALTFAYYDGAGENGLIKSVTTQNGEVTNFVYLSGTTKLEKITTTYTNLATSQVETISRVSYTYNTAGRLSEVKVDLTPLNGGDDVTYNTNYGYDTAGRVNQITQTDGSQLDIVYDTSGRVTQLTQTVVAGTTPITRVTLVEYLSATSTKITDPAGQETTLTYDTQGRMTGVTMPPAVSGGTAQVMQFTYDGDGNVLSVNAGPNNVTTYEYESAWGGINGNWTIKRDGAGNTVRRTYGANNELLTETLYTTPDPAPDEAGVGQAAGPLTTRYAYDVENHLRFIVDGEGGVTEFTYLTSGVVNASVGYTASKYDISALAATDSIAASALSAWVGGLADKSTVEKANYGYDSRGNIVTGQVYAIADAAGAGSATDRTRVFYTYDQAGRMLTRRVDTSAVAETFVYDGLGRVVASTDYAGVETSVQFNNTATTTVVTLSSGLTKTSVYNRAGELISYTQAATGVATATSAYRYDAMGRLRIAIDATGVSTHYLYDFVGRKVAEITANGALTEYGYNANDRLIKTVRYATALTSAQLASLVDVNGNPTNVDLTTLRPTGVATDRWEWRIYDNAQRLIEVIDAAGFATIYTYDGASRLITTTRHANKIEFSLVTGYKTTPPTTKVTPTLSPAEDRVERNFYDAAGLIVGTLDAEGYLTQIVRDAAGQKIKTVGYAAATAAVNRASGSFATLLADVTATANPDDIETRFVYDGRGFLRAVIDGEGNLTRYNYSVLGYLTQEIRGQQMTAAQIQTFEALPRTIANLPAATVGVQLDTTTWTRDHYGQVLTEVRALTSGAEGVTYTYDQQRRLIKTATTGTGVDARTQNQRYDALGRLIWTLSGEGSIVLAALGATPDPEDVDAVYDDYGVFYVYDEAGRLVSKTTPNGDGNTRLRTLYYYDDTGNLTHTVNTLGEVVEHRYSVFGQRTDTIVYAARLNVNDPAWPLLKGGRISQDANFTALFAVVPNAAADSQTHIDYNVTGTVSHSLDAVGYAAPTQYKQIYTYNAFRELLTQVEWIVDSSTTLVSDYAYDRRGLLLSSTRDTATGGLALQTSYMYDAFGRVRFVTDPKTLTRETRYDRAGQVTSTIDALNGTTTYAYDGRGNVLTITDRNGKQTTFAYTAHGRQVTMTTAEGMVTTTKTSAYGQVLTITDGAGRICTWTYNKDGELKTFNNGAGTETRAYDMAGRLKEVTDARGFKTAYAYDGAGRVLTRAVDPTGLNLITTYEYDSKGQQWRITDAAGVVTQITFDKNGQKTLVAVDPTGLNLRTAYVYDRAGRVTTVTQGSGASPTRITQHTYDKTGRLIKTQINPSGLNLTTEYAYDKNGNLIARKDAAGAVSRFVYDAENRLIHAVDGGGGVVTHTYDAEGRVTSTRGYTNVISSATLAAWATAGWKVAITAADVTGAITTATNDHLTHFVYDGDGRLRFSVDAKARPTQYVYDGVGNLVRTIEYAGTIAPAASYSLAYVQGEIATKGLDALVTNQVTRAAYDGANRQVYGIDAVGRVTLFARDAAGNVINQRQYAALYTGTDDPTKAALDTWATTNASTTNDRITRFRYDNAGRLAYEVDALGYVTEYEYEEDGQLAAKIRYASTYTVIDTTTTAGLTNAIGALPATAAVTSFTYDAAGRLTDIADPDQYVTHLVLDVLGQATETIRAYNTTDASTTRRVYDAAGRVTSETVAYGVSGVATTTTYTYDGVGRVLTSTIGGAVTARTYDGAGRLASQTRGSGAAEASSTAYGYDGIGQLVSEVDGRLNTIMREYDALGHVTKVITPLDAGPPAEVINEYDLLGNLVKVTDPRTNVGYFYYDELNRLELQIDPEGYATSTTYTMGGEVESVTRYWTKTTGADVGAPPTIATHAKDATTTIGRDKLDRVTSTTDAGNFVETYGLDSFGNRTSVTNKLGGVTTNTYNKRGLLTQESKAVTWTKADGTAGSQTIVNKYEYDGRGNRTKVIEAFAQPEVRTTTFGYDQADRLTSKTGDAVEIVSSTTNLSMVSTITLSETYKYDLRGNLTETVDAAGARTLYYYDKLNRRTAQLNALGGARTWAYDANGNVASERAYGTAVTLPASGGALPTLSGEYRETLYAYDKNNRLIETRVEDLRTGAWDISLDPDAYNTAIGDVFTTRQYDMAGNVVKETDGAGNSTFFYYDKLGRLAAQVDPELYMTRYTRDAEGNVTKEERFATQVASPVVGTTPTPTMSAILDRVTDFEYDSNGRRTKETRTGVVARTVDSNGALVAASTNAVIEYEYNGLGQVTQKVEANGDTTDYAYDKFGRQVFSKEATFTDHLGASVRRLTENSYDRLNNVTQTLVRNATSTSSSDRTTTFIYGAGGRLVSMTDAGNFTRTFGYDKVGRVLKEEYVRVKSDGATVTEASAYRYDLLGRTTFQAQASKSGSTWTFGDQTQIAYNTYGEVSAKGMNSLWQETFDYDPGGRLWRSTAGDGTIKLFLYDKAGRATLTIGTSGGDLSAKTIEGIAAELTNNWAANTEIGDVDLAGVTLTFAVYDKRGQQAATIEPYREYRQNASNPAINDKMTIARSRAYNAFGEVISETDARNYTTDFTYNTMGRLIEKKSPQVSVTGENGVSSNQRPTETYYYDLSGRLVGVKDANNSTTTRELLAGSGHGGAEAKVLREFHPDQGVLTTEYDVFGDLREITNEIGKVETRAYDKMGRLVTLVRPQRTGGVQLTEYYSYDGLGQRLAHWNSQLKNTDNTPVTERTDYDAQGRVTQMVDFGGNLTTYSYAWSASTATTGLGTFGGWTKTTSIPAGKTATEKTDYFGRMVDKVDYGAHDYNYSFDKAGRLINQTNSAGQRIDYSWFNTGKQASSVDGPTSLWVTQQKVANYAYDADGNRTFEKYASNTYTYNSSTGTYTLSSTTVYQNSTVTWDALNRMVSFTDDAPWADNTVTVDHEYDANGNVRRMRAEFLKYDGVTPIVQDYWYLYDSMNRFVTAKGVLSGTAGAAGTTIVRGIQGVDLTYDAAGQRLSATTTTRTQTGTDTSTFPFQPIYTYQHIRQTYTYTADGFLHTTAREDAYNSNPFGAPLLWRTLTRDAMGRITTAVESSKTRTIDYNNKSEIIHEKTVDSEPSWTTQSISETYYDYRMETTPGNFNGAYLGGLVTHTSTESWRLLDNGAPHSDITDTQNWYGYEWWDGGVRDWETADSDQDSTSDPLLHSYYDYDHHGHLTHVDVDDGDAKDLTYVNDVRGQVLERVENPAATLTNKRTVYYYFDGQRVGEVYYVNANGNAEGAFDQSYEKIGSGQEVTSGNAPTATKYTVRAGDSFASIARTLWGDAALWWMIADYNGMTSDTELAEGMTLHIPNMVANQHYNADTFRPYDPNKAIGRTSPTVPKPLPPSKGGGCGFAQMFIAIIAIVVVAVVAPHAIAAVANALAPAGVTVTASAVTTALSTGGAIVGAGAGGAAVTLSAGASLAAIAAGGAVAGAMGSIVSQGVAMATGLQDKFSWNAVGLSAIGAGISGGLAYAGPLSGGGIPMAMARGAVSNAATQGIGVATGLQERFDWTGVAVAGVMAGAGRWAGGMMMGALGVENAADLTPGQELVVDAASGMAGAIAGAGAASLINGSDFGDNLMAYLPSAIASTLGNAIARGIAGRQQMATAKGDSGSSSSDGWKLGDPIPSFGVSEETLAIARSLGQGSGGYNLGGETQSSLSSILTITGASTGNGVASGAFANVRSAELTLHDTGDIDAVTVDTLVVTAPKGARGWSWLDSLIASQSQINLNYYVNDSLAVTNPGLAQARDAATEWALNKPGRLAMSYYDTALKTLGAPVDLAYNAMGYVGQTTVKDYYGKIDSGAWAGMPDARPITGAAKGATGYAGDVLTGQANPFADGWNLASGAVNAKWDQLQHGYRIGGVGGVVDILATDTGTLLAATLPGFAGGLGSRSVVFGGRGALSAASRTAAVTARSEAAIAMTAAADVERLLPLTARVNAQVQAASFAARSGGGEAIESIYRAKYIEAYEGALVKVELDIDLGKIKAPAGQPPRLFRAGRVDSLARAELRRFAQEQGHGDDIVRINRRLYLDDQAYRIPDVYFPQSGVILDGTLGTKTIHDSQIIDFWAANGNAPIGIVRPSAYGGSYWLQY